MIFLTNQHLGTGKQVSRLVVKMGINDTDVIAVYNSMPINGNIAIQKKQLTDSKPGWLKKKKKKEKMFP